MIEFDQSWGAQEELKEQKETLDKFDRTKLQLFLAGFSDTQVADFNSKIKAPNSLKIVCSQECKPNTVENMFKTSVIIILSAEYYKKRTLLKIKDLIFSDNNFLERRIYVVGFVEKGIAKNLKGNNFFLVGNMSDAEKLILDEIKPLFEDVEVKKEASSTTGNLSSVGLFETLTSSIGDVGKRIFSFAEKTLSRSRLTGSSDNLSKCEKTIPAQPLNIYQVKILSPPFSNIYQVVASCLDKCEEDLRTYIESYKKINPSTNDEVSRLLGKALGEFIVLVRKDGTLKSEPDTLKENTNETPIFICEDEGSFFKLSVITELSLKDVFVQLVNKKASLVLKSEISSLSTSSSSCPFSSSSSFFQNMYQSPANQQSHALSLRVDSHTGTALAKSQLMSSIHETFCTDQDNGQESNELNPSITFGTSSPYSISPCVSGSSFFASSLQQECSDFKNNQTYICGNIFFKRHEVLGDGDCGYTAFGITRLQAHQLIRDNLNQVTHLLQPALREALPIQAFFDYLQEKGVLAKDVSLERLMVHLEEYTVNLNILNAYIDYDIHDKRIDAGWAHPAVLQAMAFLQNIELYIWTEDNNKIVPHHFFHSIVPNHEEDSRQRIDLLSTGGNHFERLEITKCTSSASMGR